MAQGRKHLTSTCSDIRTANKTGCACACLCSWHLQWDRRSEENPHNLMGQLPGIALVNMRTWPKQSRRRESTPHIIFWPLHRPTFTHTHIHTRAHTHMRTRMHKHTHAYTHAYTHTHAYTYVQRGMTSCLCLWGMTKWGWGRQSN